MKPLRKIPALWTNIFAYLFIVSFASSCNVNASYENRENDKKDGEKVTEEFYKFMSKNDFAGTYPLYSDEFFTKIDTATSIAYYSQIDSNCGVVVDYKLVDWKTSIIKGTNPMAEYYYVYEVNRERCKTYETFLLKKEGDKIGIWRYDVKRAMD